MARAFREIQGESQDTDISSESGERPSSSNSPQPFQHGTTTPSFQPSQRGTTTPSFVPSGAKSELSRNQKRIKSQKKEAKKEPLIKYLQCPSSDREFEWIDEVKTQPQLRTPSPRYSTANRGLKQLEDVTEILDPEDRKTSKEMLKQIVIANVTNESFDPVIGDQMSRLTTHFLEEENNACEPPVSSSHRPGPAAVERHDIFTDDEDGVQDPQESERNVPLDTESQIGRITQIREDVEESNIQFTHDLLSIGRSDYPIQEEDIEPKEITVLQSIDDDDLAEELCIREAKALSLEVSAASSADVTDVLQVPDTSNDAAIAEAVDQALNSDFRPNARRPPQQGGTAVPAADGRQCVILDYRLPKIEF